MRAKMATLSFSRQVTQDRQLTNIRWTTASETCIDALNGALIPENLSRKWARQRPQRLCKKNLNAGADLRAPELVVGEFVGADEDEDEDEDLVAVLVSSLARLRSKTELWRFRAGAQVQQAPNACPLRLCHLTIDGS